jgi:SAM-dependent methyltransferase
MIDSARTSTTVSASPGHTMEGLSREQAIEVEFWRTSPNESPDSNAVENILHKCAEARLFLSEFRIHNNIFAQASVVLELGAGQAWASALVKRELPHLVAYASDISPYAVRSVSKWEHVFCSKVDRVFACPSSEIPLENESVDLVFCFQAAHHFREHRTTLVEIKRVLKSSGVCLYLQEPSCPRFWYRLANWRVNRKRPEVPEDVIVHRKLVAIAEEIGFSASYNLVPHTMNRGTIETIYYAFLCRVKPLQHLLPCGADYIFRKP